MLDDRVAVAKILIVDDEPANVRLLERLLATAGYHGLESTTDAREVLTRFRALQPDLVLLDLMMPYLDGIAVLAQLAAEISEGDFVPVLVLTADVTLDAKRRALAAGASDFLTKPFEQVEVILRIQNLLKTRSLYRALDAQNRSLEQTVRERTERLLQSEKVATMGSLLAGVAHELNNPLAVLSGHAHLLHETAAEPTLVRRAEKIKEATDRCVRIVRNFLALARQHPPERSEVSLPRVIEGAVELLAYELQTDDVTVTVDVADGLPTFSADPHQLHQVVVNLLANAHHAMRDASQPRSITLTGRHDASQARVLLDVTDTGPGIPAETCVRVFEPFFTTKPVGQGTGLGLSLCRGIIEEHGGRIAVYSEIGRGTRFAIELPVGASHTVKEDEADEDVAPSIGRKAILVVDDEPEVAAVVVEALGRDGHEVHVARNGAMALGILAKRQYDLIVCDTKMPVLDGEAFYDELTRRFPALRDRLVFQTGDVLSEGKRQFLERTGRPFLMKPADLGELRRLVYRTLRDTSG